MTLATVMERLARPHAPGRKSWEDTAAQLFELNRRWREGFAELDKAQADVDRLDDMLGEINNEAQSLVDDPGLSDEEWQALVDAGLHPDEWETGSVPSMPAAPGKSARRPAQKREDGMGLASALQRLTAKVETPAPEGKAETEALLAQLVAKERECEAKLQELNAFIGRYGVESGDVDHLDTFFSDELAKAQVLQDAFDDLVSQEQEIVAQLEGEGLDYPFGLDLEFV